ncbi:MAG: c-type cytochrome [Ignavibacteriales bacterium]
MKYIFILVTGIWMIVISFGARFAYGEENLVEKGKELYTQKKCSMCHKIEGVGGKMGPDLSDEGNKGRTEDWLMKYFKDPKSVMPEAKMRPVKGTDEELKALVAYMTSLKKTK